MKISLALDLKGLEVIEWLDHYKFPSWNDSRPANALRPVRIVSVGWVVEEDKDVVLFAESRAFNGDTPGGFGQLRGILKKGITARHKLR